MNEMGSINETNAGVADASKYYKWPMELPSIKEAVNDLALVLQRGLD